MSTWRATTVTCPRCSHAQPARVADGVHVTRVPRVRDDVLARRFQELGCMSCGARLVVHVPFVYTDFDRDQWILVATADELASWPAWERRLRDDLTRAFERGSPLAHELGARMSARVVFGYEQLREKLVVWAAGLEDAIVECLKVRAFADDITLAAPGSRLFVDRVDHDGTIHAGWFARGDDHVPTRSIVLPAAWVDTADRDRSSLVERFRELWVNGFVDVVRLQW